GLAAPALLAQAEPEQPCDPEPRRTKTAAVVTVYHHYSHADVLIGRLLSGDSANAVWTSSHTHVVSLHADQVPPNADMSRDLAARNGFHIYRSIRDALTLGGKSLAVDGVVFVGEHGDYPTNDVGQILYPRYELFNQILDVYEHSGRSVPTFFDKHFSYSWDKAKAIYDRAKKIGFPFMAGSSIPLTIRRPALDPPLETPITEAVALGYGDPDAYGFHTLEGLQCMVERRKGGETGIASVQWIEGPAIEAWRNSPQGSWSKPLFQPLFEAARRLNGLPPSALVEEHSKKPVLFVLNYRDGLKAAALVLTRNVGFSAAFRVKGQAQVQFTAFSAPVERPLPNWDGMARCVDRFLGTGEPPNPAERTLLTTGALAFCFASKRTGNLVETPELQVRYRGPAHSWFQTA
ncbi:MAG: hypothetical protein ACRD9L_10710, partial [Bryobacteraceae bacterium]